MDKLNYTIGELKKISELMNDLPIEDESSAFFKGVIKGVKNRIDWLIKSNHLVMAEGFSRTNDIDLLILSYDYTTQYIEDSGQRHKAERKNDEIEDKLKQLGVLEFRNIKIR